MNRLLHASLLITVVAALAAGCKPDLGAPQSLITSPRLLAVRGEPAEARPGDPVTYDALAVDAAGRLVDAGLGWSLCHVPKPPAEANAVSGACLDAPDDAGPAPTFMTPMPTDACMLFGPITPPAAPGQPPLRPRDPDVTGGFYQPVRVTLSVADLTERAFGLERIRCNLANAPVDVTRTFNSTYQSNLNPVLARVTLDPDGAPAPLYAAGAPPTPATVAAGAPVTLEAAWPDDTPESYPVWNVVTRQLETRREAIRVSWFATAGAFQHDRTGRGEMEPETFARDIWTAPAETGDVHLWVVLRDSRGGVDFGELQLTVTP